MLVTRFAFAITCLVSSSVALPHPDVHHDMNIQERGDYPLPKEDPWYAAPEGYEDAAPGDILKTRDGPGSYGLFPDYSKVWNVLYRTTNSLHNPEFAVTTLFAPEKPSGDGNRLVTYLMHYDSANLDASPSASLHTIVNVEIRNALRNGFFVNVPDYEGPLAAFGAGVMSGQAVLDSVKAVLAFDSSTTGLIQPARSALWGYSGGALAGEWAAELQPTYAPDLPSLVEFQGAVLGGMVPDVLTVLEAVNDEFYASLLPQGVVGLTAQWPDAVALLDSSLVPETKEDFMAVKTESFLTMLFKLMFEDIFAYFYDKEAFFNDPIVTDIIDSDGRQGVSGTPTMPLFWYKPIHDEVSPVEDTDALYDLFCPDGANIHYQRMKRGNHALGKLIQSGRALEAVTSMLDGTYSHEGCSTEETNLILPSVSEDDTQILSDME